MNNEESKFSNEKSSIEKSIGILSKKYVIAEKWSVRSWRMWLAVSLLGGFAIGIMWVANRSGEFNPSTASVLSPATTANVAFGDSFDRPDNAELGNDWLQAQSSFHVFDIKDGEVRTVEQTLGPSIAVRPQSIGSAQTVSMSFASTDNNGGPAFGLVLRYQNSNNYYALYRQTGGVSMLRISKFVDGKETVLAQTELSNPPKDVYFRLSASVDTGALTLELQDPSRTTTLKVQAQDTTFLEGSFGFLIGSKSVYPGLRKSQRADLFNSVDGIVSPGVGGKTGINITHGPLIGDIGPDHARIWIRTSTTSNVTMSYGPAGGQLLSSAPMTTASSSDFTATVFLSGLAPNTSYTCSVLVDGTPNASCDFTTAPQHGDPSPVTVAFISDVFGSQPAPILNAIDALNPAGFFIIGDYDHRNPATNVLTAEGYLEKIRTMHKSLRDKTTLFGTDFATHIINSRLPVLARILDDHDSGNDNVSINFKWWPQNLQAFLEYNPVPEDNGFASGYMWQSIQRGRALFILMDLRSHRETAAGDKHTILGDAQKVWLTNKLTQCAKDPTITWCVLVSTVPFNPNQSKLDSWSGYKDDRQWLLREITNQGVRNALIVSGDCHFGSIVAPPLSPLHELNIPKSNAGFGNTCNNQDAQWTLNQSSVHTGFGLLTLTPATATMEIRDETGKIASSNTNSSMSFTITAQ